MVPDAARAGSSVLVIERDRDLAGRLGRCLEDDGYLVSVRASADGGLAALQELAPDAVIFDLATVGAKAAPLLAQIAASDARAPVIALAGAGDEAGSFEAIMAGAVVLARAHAPGAVRMLLQRAFVEQRRASVLEYYQQREGERTGLQNLVGESTPMLRLKVQLKLLLDAEAQRHAADPRPVLLLGEAGTGKEHIARALHFEGARRKRPFVRLDCAALPPPQLETRLFGREPGAGAHGRRLGLLEAADGGTLFIDEVGEMPPGLQGRFLDLLRRRTMRRVGGRRDIPVDVRIVAASRRPLQAWESEGRLQAELCRRLGTSTELQVAPLRERGEEDLELLSNRFIAWHCERQVKPAPSLSGAALAMLASQRWPGNVRELHSVIARAVGLEPGGLIEAQHIALAPPAPRPSAEAPPEIDLRRLECNALLRALERAHWNVCQAARLLGISRDTLRYRIGKHGLARHMPGWLPRAPH